MNKFLVVGLTFGIATIGLFAGSEVQASETSKSHSLNQINSSGITTGTYVVKKVRETGGKIYMEAFPKGISIPENQPKSIVGTFEKSQFVGLEKLRVGSEVSVYGVKIYVL